MVVLKYYFKEETGLEPLIIEDTFGSVKAVSVGSTPHRSNTQIQIQGESFADADTRKRLKNIWELIKNINLDTIETFKIEINNFEMYSIEGEKIYNGNYSVSFVHNAFQENINYEVMD